jgi:hypothetical protein
MVSRTVFPRLIVPSCPKIPEGGGEVKQKGPLDERRFVEYI